MSIPLRQRLTSAFNCTSQDTLIRPHFSFQIPGSRPSPSPTFSRLSLLFLAGASLTSCRLCVRLRLCMKLWVTYTPADWVCLFEVRFSLRVRHLRQRSPAGGWPTTLTALARSLWCSGERGPASPMTVSGTAHSLWSPSQVTSGALLRSSRAWSGSASCSLGITGGEAGLVRSASLDARPLALPMLLSLASPERAKPEASLFVFFSSQFEPAD